MLGQGTGTETCGHTPSTPHSYLTVGRLVLFIILYSSNAMNVLVLLVKLIAICIVKTFVALYETSRNIAVFTGSAKLIHPESYEYLPCLYTLYCFRMECKG